MFPRLLPILPMLVLLGCHGASTPLETPESGGEASARRAAQAETAEPDEVAETQPGRVRYDLAAHLDRAEIRRGDTLLVDFGSTGGAKYTLGGWLTAIRGPIDVDGTRAAVTTAPRARFNLPRDRPGPATLVVSGRLLGVGPVRAYVDGTEIGTLDLPGDRFAVASLDLPDDLGVGEHTLLLRVRRTRRVAGLRAAGVALQWARVGPRGEPGTDEASSGPTPFLRGTHPGVQVPEDVRVGWALEVPAAARLRGIARGAEDAALAVIAHTDTGAPTELGRVRASPEGVPFDLPLDDVAGRLVRLDLGAVGGELRLIHPAIVTLDATEVATPPRPRNVIVYLIDTLRADKLSPYDAETRVRTPGLDTFVQSAATFLSAHSPENWTKPSVATLLSSLMPWQHTAIRGESVVPSSVELLPELLGEHGFYTGSFIANGYVSDRFGFRQGWDTYRNYIREGRRTPAQYVATDVLAWLDDRPEDRPFFLYIHTIDPHVPYRPPRAFVEMYQPERYRGPVSFNRDATLLENVKAGRLRLGARDRRQLEALYDGEITYHDIHFHSIIEGLARRGLADDTMVIITSDHGEEFWDHGSVGHGHNVYEELLHVPLFVRIPGLTDGPQRLDEPVGLADVLPTVTDALGLPTPESASGRSLLPLLTGGDQSAPRYTVSGFMEGWRTVVVGQIKLIHRTAERVMLHDLATDPDEQTDVAAERPISVRYARGLLGLALAETAPGAPTRGRRNRRHRPTEVEIDPETAAQLRALGYVH